VSATEPDVVVVAAGARDRTDGLQILRPGLRPSGLDEMRIVTAADVLRGERSRTVASAVILDDRGGYDAVGAAELLARRGTRVHVVTRFAEMGAALAATLEQEPAQRRLAAL